MTGLAVRPAEPADYAVIGAFTVAAYEADGQLGPGTAYGRVLADVAGRAVDADVLCAVDGASGEVLGAVTFMLAGSVFAELARPGEAEFRTLAVAPGAQRRGVGEALVRACVLRAGEAGCAAVVIYVRDFADSARRLYARLGFEPVPDRDWTPVPDVRLLALRHPLRPRAGAGMRG